MVLFSVKKNFLSPIKSSGSLGSITMVGPKVTVIELPTFEDVVQTA